MSRKLTKANVTKWLKAHGLVPSRWLPSSRTPGWGIRTSGFYYGEAKSPLHLVVKYRTRHEDAGQCRQKLRDAKDALSEVYDVEERGDDSIIVWQRYEVLRRAKSARGVEEDAGSDV